MGLVVRVRGDVGRKGAARRAGQRGLAVGRSRGSYSGDLAVGLEDGAVGPV